MRRFTTLLLLLGLVGAGVILLRPPPPEASFSLTDDLRRQPAEWGWMQRTYPHFNADPAAYREAVAAAQRLRRLSKRGPLGQWVTVGPTNIGGRVVDVAFDPHDPQTVFAAAATGGVFKSTDRGNSWLPVFDDQALLTIGDLALDPVNPGVLYVGTGEANGGHNNFSGGGLYRSDDSGRTWRFLGLENTTSIGRVLVHPTQPERLFVAAMGSYFAPTPDRGLYRSLNGGDTWQKVLFLNDSTGVIDVLMKPDAPEVMLAATWQRVRRPQQSQLFGIGSGIHRSTDGGTTWTPLGPAQGLPHPQDHITPQGEPRFGRIGLTVSRDNPSIMYALYNDGSRILGLYRSQDAGRTWVKRDLEDQLFQNGGSFSWYFGQVRAHPTDPDYVYVLDVPLLLSPDGGRRWAKLESPSLHVDHHALAFAYDDPDYLISGNDGGINISEDRGATWRATGPLPITQFYEIGVDPADPNTLYGGTQDNGTIRTDGGTDQWAQILGGDGFYVLVDPTNPDVIFAETQFGGLFRSDDGGLTFLPILRGVQQTEPRNWSTPIAMDPTDPNTLYYGTLRLYRSRDGGSIWAPLSDNLTGAGRGSTLGTLTTIAVAPSDPQVIYVGTDIGLVWMTPDAGVTWREISAGLPNRWVTRLAVHPEDPNTAYVTFSGLKWKEPTPHVFQTTDQGQTWTDRSGNLPDAPVNGLALDPLYPDLLYVGTDVGAFMSFDAGESWEPLGQGMPNVSVYDLKVIPGTLTLAAGTHGRSMYTLDLSPIHAQNVVALQEGLVAQLEPAFPNPFSDQTTIRFALAQQARVTVTAFDLLGRRVGLLYDRDRVPGRYAFQWDGRLGNTPLPAGPYFLQLALDGRPVKSRGITVIR